MWIKYLPLLTAVVGNVVTANVLPPKYQAAVTTASLILLALRRSILPEKPDARPAGLANDASPAACARD